MVLTMLISYQTANAQGTDRDKINSTMMNLLNEWDRDAYTGILDLIAQVLDYDTEEIVAYAHQQLQGMKTPVGDTYHLTFNPTAFYGDYTVVNNRWVRQGDADHIKLSFPDRQGNACVAIVTMSGEKKSFTIHDVDPISEKELESYKERSEKLYNFMMGFANIVNNVTEVTMEMRENVEVSFTQGGKELMHANANFDMSGIKDDWTILDGMTLSGNVSFARSDGPGTFDLSLNKTGYLPGMGLNIDFTSKKGDKQLVAFKLSAPGTFTGLDESLNLGFQSLNIDIDVLGEIQARGGISNLPTFIQTLMMSIASGKGSRSKRAPFDLSQLFAINIYYDNQPEVKGTFTLAPTLDEDGDLTLIPTIGFTSDGSSYNVTDYFTAENFPEVKAKATEIYTDAKGLIDIVMQKAGLSTGLYRLMTKQSAESVSDGPVNLLGQKGSSRPGVYILKTDSGVKKIIRK